MSVRAIAARAARWLPWLGPPVVLAALGHRHRWVAEDAFISFRVVDNLLAGHGPVYNVGERVEAYTHPLWLAMLATLQAFGANLAHAAPLVGLALSVTGLVAAQEASSRIARCRHEDGAGAPPRFVPFGAAVFVALQVVWDFATSALETGLIFAWLGVSYALVARDVLTEAPPAERTGLASALIAGLGPLVRPDLAVMSVPLFLALCVRPIASGKLASIARMFAVALALPVAYQIFRMGYFAALVPNTALAKEAGEAYWSAGLLYLRDFSGPYRLWIPAMALVVWSLRDRARGPRRSPGMVWVLLAAPVVAGALHAAWVVRVGGDFMHGRFLLPSFFAVLAPLAMVRVPGRRWSWDTLLIVIVLTWAIGCGAFLRWSPPAMVPTGPPRGIVDERRFYFEVPGRPRPIIAKWTVEGLELRRRADAAPRSLEWHDRVLPLAPAVDARILLAVPHGNIGLRGYFAGPRVHIVDTAGLGDPVASRLRLESRDRAGHEKHLPLAWVVARFADGTVAGLRDDVVAARAALACGRLAELLEAVTAPLTLERFRHNLRLSWRLTRLRIAPDPQRARAELCEGR
jgi:arabinofuranosyltransferase